MMGSTDSAHGSHDAPRDHGLPSWSELVRPLALSPSEPVLAALSGGADSVFLLHVLALARNRPRILAVHVNHRLRGAESDGEATFCAELCRSLDVDWRLVEAPLDPASSNLEARARRTRYVALCDCARAAGIRIVATGHHADDALETMLLRWVRGSELLGLPALRRRMPLTGFDRRSPLQIGEGIELIRPLLDLRRETLRELCASRGLPWCEDSSNRDLRFTRNRVRQILLPEIERLCGRAGVETLREFLKALEKLEAQFSAQTAHLSWSKQENGWTIARAELALLPAPLMRHALWRLCSAVTGRSLGGDLLTEVCSELAAGKTARHTLPGGFALVLSPQSLAARSPPARGDFNTPAE